jgi:putative phage-type endonuclease
MVAVYFKTSAKMTPRQGGDPLQLTPLRKASIAHKLRRLSNIPSPPQRTQEWYEMRYGLLTASNVWKALGTDAQKNQLITEKCQPFEQFKESCARHGNLSADNPMMLGQKYEPISALIYERRNKTRLGEYGCILHPEWNYLGASPDGINIDSDAAVYGRMVEIKNIVNRVIDGVPLDAYWVQMQMQMEVCDLEECDFVETRIKEYATKSEFLESDNEWRGVILTFIPRFWGEDEQQKQFYEYWMLESSQEQEQTIEIWIQSKKTQHANYVLSTVAYWGLDEYSCVLVKRNRVWFQAAIPKIEELWQTIERERITGSEHRAPKKREPKMNITITKLLEESQIGEEMNNK